MNLIALNGTMVIVPVAMLHIELHLYTLTTNGTIASCIRRRGIPAGQIRCTPISPVCVSDCGAPC